MQTGDVTPCVLGSTPAGQVGFQDLTKSANRRPLAGSAGREAHAARFLCDGHACVLS